MWQSTNKTKTNIDKTNNKSVHTHIGLHVKIQGERDVAINSCGTPEFMAPEVGLKILPFHLID